MQKAKYKRGDKVTFMLEGVDVTGTVSVVDAYGTFEQNDEPSYDVRAPWNGQVCLFKHIRQSWIKEN